MRRLVSAYIVLLLLFLPLLADGSAGALANLWVQAAVLLFSCLGAAIALRRKGWGKIRLPVKNFPANFAGK